MSWSSWLGFGSSPSPASEELQNQPTFDPTTSKDDSYKPLSREERRACWEARDKYFTCLDKHKILDALKEKDAAASKCGTQTQKFEQDCARSWVQYFKQKRVAEFEKEQKIKQLEEDGAVPPQKESSWKFW